MEVGDEQDKVRGLVLVSAYKGVVPCLVSSFVALVHGLW